MKWTYSIKNKALASIALLVLCLLVLLSNYIDRNHTYNIKKSISTLYEDRLIAEEYILKMTIFVYQIKEELKSDSSNVYKTKSINELLLAFKNTSDAYHKTKFTELEKIKADELINIIESIEPTQLDEAQKNLEFVDKALVLLDELSKIQLSESKLIMKYSEQLYLSGKTSSQFVFAVIIILLLVLQALLFTSKTLVQKTKFPNLN
ncbi:MAG: hypothetical protein R2728_11655 [Chitinophagales bacterium]